MPKLQIKHHRTVELLHTLKPEMEVRTVDMEKNNTEESNAKKMFKYQSLPIPSFSCTEWKQYRENVAKKQRKNKKKSRTRTALLASPRGSRTKSCGMIKSAIQESLSTFVSKKLVSKMKDVVVLPKNVLRKGFINSDKLSIEDKLRNMYLTDVMEEKAKLKDDRMEKDVNVNFVCNYLEKVLYAENLSYLYLRMYPDAFLVSIHKPEMDVSEEKYILYHKGDEDYEEFLNAVNNEEIPEDVFLHFENHCDILLCNIHAILKIEKFTITEDDDENLFYSTFVLLKPTSNVMYAVLSEIEKDINRQYTFEENETSLHFEQSALLEEFKDNIITKMTREGCLDKKDIESKFYIEMSGPLQLKIDEASTLDLVNFFLRKKILFEPSTLSLQDGQACCGTEMYIDLKAEVEFNQKWLHRTFEHISPSSQEADLHDFLYLDESPSFIMRNNKMHFMNRLSKRNISEGFCIISNSRWNLNLVEIFLFKTKREIVKDTGKHRYEEVDVHYKLPVFTSNGLFYTCWSEETVNKEKTKKRKKILPHAIENITCIGSREKLDKYIYNLVEMISERFRRYLRIEHTYEFEAIKNNLDFKKCVFYTIEKYVISDFCSMETDFVEDLKNESASVLLSKSSNAAVEVADEVPKVIDIARDWQGCPCYSSSGDDSEDDDATATDDIDATTAAGDIDASTVADNFIGAATSDDDFVGADIAKDASISTTSTDYAAVDTTSTDDAAVATASTDDVATTSTYDDAFLADTSTDDNTAAVTVAYFTDDDDFDAAALDANSLNIHPDNDPNYDVDEEISEYILSCPEVDMYVEDNSLVLSSEQSMLSQAGEAILLDGQVDDKAALSDEGFMESGSDSETMSLSENILSDVEDVSHSEKTISSESAITFDQPTSSVIEDVSSIPDLLTESDLCGNQVNWEGPENYKQPAEFDPLLVLSDQHLQVSDTPPPPCPLGDSQPLSKDKYNPPTEAISDEDVPESSEKYFRSTEADSRKDILSEVLKQTNDPESFKQPAEFDPLLVLSDQRTQISGTPSGSLGDSQPVSKDIYNPPTEAISDEDVPESFEKYFRSTEAHSRKDILSKDLKQKKLIYPESFLCQGGYPVDLSSTQTTPHNAIEAFPDWVSENFKYGHPLLHDNLDLLGEDTVELQDESDPEDLTFEDSLYGNELNQKLFENTRNMKTVPSAETVPDVDTDAESNKSLDEVNLYDHEPGGKIPEKNPNLEFTGLGEDSLIDDEITPLEVPFESTSKSSGPFIYVSSIVKSGNVKTIFEAHEFEMDNASQIQLTKNDSKEEKVEVYPCLQNEFFYDPTDPNDIPDLHFDFKFEKKELDSLKKHLMCLSDVFKPHSVRKGSPLGVCSDRNFQPRTWPDPQKKKFSSAWPGPIKKNIGPTQPVPNEKNIGLTWPGPYEKNIGPTRPDSKVISFRELPGLIVRLLPARPVQENLAV